MSCLPRVLVVVGFALLHTLTAGASHLVNQDCEFGECLFVFSQFMLVYFLFFFPVAEFTLSAISDHCFLDSVEKWKGEYDRNEVETLSLTAFSFFSSLPFFSRSLPLQIIAGSGVSRLVDRQRSVIFLLLCISWQKYANSLERYMKRHSKSCSRSNRSSSSGQVRERANKVKDKFVCSFRRNIRRREFRLEP